MIFCVNLFLQQRKECVHVYIKSMCEKGIHNNVSMYSTVIQLHVSITACLVNGSSEELGRKKKHQLAKEQSIGIPVTFCKHLF